MTESSNRAGQASGKNVRMECMQAALEFQRDLARRGVTPDTDKLPHNRSRPVFEIIGAALIALGIAGVSLLGNYLIFNVMLHWTL